MKTQIDTKKIVLGVVVAAMGSAAAYYGQPLIHDNDRALGVIVTVFSILAGFLVAIIAVIGDPLILSPGTWRIAEKQRATAYNRLVRHKWLFLLYLLTLGAIFVSMLIPDCFVSTIAYLERTYLFFAAVAFMLSLRLPNALMKLQEERLDSIVEHRRSEDGIKPNKP